MDDHDEVDHWKMLLSILRDDSVAVAIDVEEEEEDEDEEYDQAGEVEEEYDYDDAVNDDSLKTNLACPFCSEDFDMLGLCCHIDSEHRLEAKAGICPLCAVKVQTNMATHVIVQHESILQALSRKKLRNGEQFSALSLLRKELLSAYSGKKCSHVNNMETNHLLLSFVSNQQPSKRSHSVISTEESLSRSSPDDHICESSQAVPSMDKDQEEKVQRCEYVKGLLFSTMFEDCL